MFSTLIFLKGHSFGVLLFKVKHLSNLVYRFFGHSRDRQYMPYCG